MGTIDLRGDGVNTEMETGSRSTAAPIVAHRASWSEKFRGTPLTEANQAIQAYAWTVGQLSVAKLPHSPTTQPQPDISFATESGHLHLLLTLRRPAFTVVALLKTRFGLLGGRLRRTPHVKNSFRLSLASLSGQGPPADQRDHSRGGENGYRWGRLAWLAPKYLTIQSEARQNAAKIGADVV